MGSSLSSINTWIISLKVVLITAAVATVAMAVQYGVPLLLDFAVYDIPAIFSVVQSCFKPPFLYFLINVIIIAIVATSRFHLHNENQAQPLINPTTVNLQEVLIHQSFGILEPPAPVKDVEEFVTTRPIWNPPPQIINFPPPPENTRSEFVSPVREKPLVTSRFALQKAMKSSPDGVRSLRVAKPKKQETLENTWKTITDGRHMPLTRHLRKSETFENHRPSEVYCPQPSEAAVAGKKKKVMKKAETLKDRTNYDNENHRPPSSTTSSPTSGGKVRKEASLSHDELNRRVEAFIKKFNDEMRMQRVESMKQYREMTNGGPVKNNI